MNKDVIYIEPEDDITDIILKIENSKEKIVAIVPPKKAGVFRSVVNIKLIEKTGTTSEKTVVLVTVDPSIIKLAAAAKIPVAKDLKSAPSVPEVSAEENNDTTEKDELVEESDGTVDTEDEKEEAVEEKEEEEEEEEEGEEKPKKKPAKKSSNKSGNKFINWIKDHKKLSIAAGICCLFLILFLVWAFAIAPAVDIAVAIKTDQKSFSQSITFTDNLSQEDAKEGKFYLEQKKIDMPQEVTFEATGKKNRGEKAHGEVVIFAFFPYNIQSSVSINAGSTFTISGLSYAANNNVALTYNGDGKEDCDNKDNAQEIIDLGCRISAKVPVTAVEGGTKYNIEPASTGWSTVASVNVYSGEPMSGGTDDFITVVQQSDIEKAKSEITNAKEEENKEKLYETIDDNYYIIDASFEQSTSAVTASPAADEEVKEGVKPTLKMTTSASVYVIDKVKLEEFINEKADLEDDQKIYEIKDIYIENLSQIKVGSTNKLKAQYFVGPKITEGEVVDRVKGKGLGDAQREIRDIYGVSDVKIDRSFPWVMSVPGDPNKIGVEFEVKDQNGNEIKQENSDEENKEDGEDDNKKSDDKKN